MIFLNQLTGFCVLIGFYPPHLNFYEASHFVHHRMDALHLAIKQWNKLRTDEILTDSLQHVWAMHFRPKSSYVYSQWSWL